MRYRPRRRLFERLRGQVGFFAERLVGAFEDAMGRFQNQLQSMERLLKQLDPQTVLKRGFSIVRVGEEIAKDASTLEKGADIRVQLARGAFDAKVNKTYAR